MIPILITGLAVSGVVGSLFQQPFDIYARPERANPPLLGFGTWRLSESASNTTKAVSYAIQVGYRHIDCAAAYGNQKDVGKGIADGLKTTGLRRDQLWITSKLWNDRHKPTDVEKGLDETLKELGLGYLDEYLMHWPVGNTGEDGELAEDYVETWHAMEALLDTNKVRYLGISNFAPFQLLRLLADSTVVPAVHQMELHPYLQQSEWIRFHQEHGIHVTAYSPFANLNPIYDERNTKSAKEPPSLLKDELLGEIAKRRGCTIPQVALAWGMSRGTSVIPKSKHPKYIDENLGSLKCDLEEDDIDKIEQHGQTYLKRFNNPSKSWGVHLFNGLDDA